MKTNQQNNKRNHRALLSIIFMASICVSSMGIASSSHGKSIKVCYDQWPPMTIFPSEESDDRGVVIDMLEQIYTAQGYNLEYYEVPLARGLDMVKQGFCDMLPEYLISETSNNDFIPGSEETFAYTTAFVVRRNDPWLYDGIGSLNYKRVATGPGWDYSSVSVEYQNYLDDPKNSNNVEMIAGSDDVVERIFRMMVDSRVDLYADNELVLQYILNKMNLNDVLKIVHPGLDKKLVELPIFSKKMSEEKRNQLIKIWNEGRISLKGEQEKNLLLKYNITLDASDM